MEVMTIVGVSDANFAANALGQGYPNGGAGTVTWPSVLGLLTVIQVHTIASWGHIVVKVLITWIVG